jgi:hypothetical protein
VCAPTLLPAFAAADQAELAHTDTAPAALAPTADSAAALLLLLLQGDFVVGWMGPEPGKGTHRYALLMFEQPGFQTIEPPTKRAYFQTKHVSTSFCLGGKGVTCRHVDPFPHHKGGPPGSGPPLVAVACQHSVCPETGARLLSKP